MKLIRIAALVAGLVCISGIQADDVVETTTEIAPLEVPTHSKGELGDIYLSGHHIQNYNPSKIRAFFTRAIPALTVGSAATAGIVFGSYWLAQHLPAGKKTTYEECYDGKVWRPLPLQECPHPTEMAFEELEYTYAAIDKVGGVAAFNPSPTTNIDKGENEKKEKPKPHYHRSEKTAKLSQKIDDLCKLIDRKIFRNCINLKNDTVIALVFSPLILGAAHALVKGSTALYRKIKGIKQSPHQFRIDIRSVSKKCIKQMLHGCDQAFVDHVLATRQEAKLAMLPVAAAEQLS